MKIVVNRCYGIFSVSEKVYDLMGIPWDGRGHFSEMKIEFFKKYGVVDGELKLRSLPKLVSAVETLGRESWGRFAELRVVEIPDGIEVEIESYDGMETIHEKHRTW